ncbi:hypothetical protein NK326_24585, partial [Salmonella enterica]|nr:hypothetical protein [Salmonella enterica]
TPREGDPAIEPHPPVGACFPVEAVLEPLVVPLGQQRGQRLPLRLGRCRAAHNDLLVFPTDPEAIASALQPTPLSQQ